MHALAGQQLDVPHARPGRTVTRCPLCTPWQDSTLVPEAMPNPDNRQNGADEAVYSWHRDAGGAQTVLLLLPSPRAATLNLTPKFTIRALTRALINACPGQHVGSPIRSHARDPPEQC